MKNFYLTNKWKTILSLWTFILICLVIGPFMYFIKAFSIFYITLGTFSFLTSVYSLFKDRLVVTENGIEYHKWIYEFGVKWTDINRIGHYWFREGLLINKEPIRYFGNHYNFVTYLGLGRYAFIPLSSFSRDWRNDDLGQQIKQHAPHLFEEE